MYAEFHELTLPELLLKQADHLPEEIYLRNEAIGLTYSEVRDRAISLAAGFIKLGLQPGDRLAIRLPNTPEFVVTLFAAGFAGLIAVPINPRRHPSELQYRLAKTRAAALVFTSDMSVSEHADDLSELADTYLSLPELRYRIDLAGPSENVLDWHAVRGERPEKWPETEPGDIAAILFTLGSLGTPRGAALRHRSLLHNAADMAEIAECSPQDVFLGAIPFTNVFGLTATILKAAIAGAQIVCINRYKPAEVLDTIEKYQVTVHHGVPTMFALELNDAAFRPDACRSLRTGIMSGAHCPPELVRRVQREMGCDVLLAYGLTETSPSVCMTHFSDGPVTRTETVGRPMPGVEIRAADADGEPLPAGQEGELWVRGYNVMTGYWEDAEATALAFSKYGWLRTSDLGVVDPNGPVRILGRVSDQINRAGFKIYPSTVEMVLRACPGVRDAAVVGIPDLIFGELTCACIVRQPASVSNGNPVTTESLLGYARDHLPDYAVPDRVLFFDALPRVGSGPVMKDNLRRRVRLRGHAWKFGRNIDTDAIIPARRCNTADPAELARYCMEDADTEFIAKMTRGDLIIADHNFGCGSSREVAPLSIKAAGVSAVIAKSFARIFFRNAINIGLPILESPAAVDGIREGDEIEVEAATGVIRNLTRDEVYTAEPFPDFLRRIIEQGGLLAYVEERLAEAKETV